MRARLRDRCRPALLRRSAFCFGILTLAAAASAPAPLRAQQRGYEDGIVEIIAERLPPLTLLTLVDSAGAMLLPVRTIAEYLGLTVARTGDVLTLPRLAGGTHTLHLDRPRIESGATTVELAPAEIAVVEDQVYLRLERLELILEADITLNRAALTVVIERDAMFPAQQRIVAEQRRAMLLARQSYAQQHAGRDTVPYRAATGAGIVDWEIATRGLDPTRLTTVRTQAGAALLGGALTGNATVELGRDAIETLRDVALRYHRVFPHGRGVTQVRAGDMLSTGLFSRFLRGVEVTNRPYLRSYELGDVLVSPDLPAGWDYEVFQGNQLLGFSEGGARAPVAIPLRSGATPVQVRMYGPAGEEVVSTLLYQAPVSMLRPGAFEYIAGAGGCDGVTCRRFGHADARYGATSFLTVGGGLEMLADSAGDHYRPYVVSSFTTGIRTTGEVTLMPGALYSAAVALFPRDASSAHLRASLSRPGFGPISLIPDAARRWDVEATWDERLTGRDLPFSQLRAGTALAGGAEGIDRFRVSASGSFPRGYSELRYDIDRFSRHAHMLSGRIGMTAPVTVRGTRYIPLVTAALGVGRVGFRLAELGASLQPRPNVNVHTSVQWHRGQSSPSLAFGYIARLGPFQSAIRALASPDRGGSSALMLSGATAITPGGHITHLPVARTGYAGVTGTVFVDLNGDGVFSDGDRTVPDVHLVVGGQLAQADEAGEYRLWGLQPYAVAAVAIDSARAADPSWITAVPEILVRPVPNTSIRADIQLIRTRELIGMITAAPEVPTVGGLTLEITSVATGTVTTAVTFSDGQYYVSRIRPGRYTLRVAPSSLAAIDAAAPPPLEFTVPAAGDEIVVELPPLHLRR